MKTSVFITIDTELSMGGAWQRADLEPLDMDTCVFCKRQGGSEYGIRAIMSVLEEHGLRGVFFVDTTMRELCNASQFDDCCREIAARGHDVQLHLHPACRAYVKLRQQGIVAGQAGVSDMLCDYSLDEQTAMIIEGCDVLAATTGQRPLAIRAGNYAVNNESLQATERAGVPFDFSVNAAYQPDPCRIDAKINRPARLAAVTEIPVTQLLGRRLPGIGYRPLQISCVSSDEICLALRQINAGGGRTASIVAHSFSLLKNRSGRWRKATLDKIVLRRLEVLAAFLAENSQQFSTATVSQCAATEGWLEEALAGREVWPRTNWPCIARRHIEQLISRI